MALGPLEFLRGGGELGALIRSRDWSATSLGPAEHWPQSLKTAIRIMLTSRQPIWVGWGPELTYFYNDAYKAIIGGKHPDALGQPTIQVWREIQDDIGPLLDTAMSGEEGTYVEAQLLIMERNGYPEETYYTFSYSPIPAEDGSAGGIICANSDDTGRVIGERQLALLRELGARTADARGWDETRHAIEQALSSDPHDISFALLYMADPAGTGFTRVALSHLDPHHPAAPEQLAANGPWPLAEALGGHAPLLLEDLDSRFPSGFRSAVWDRPVTRAALLPLPAAGDQGRAGVLVVGLNPYRLFDDGYQGFLNLAAGQIAAAFANGEAYEQERRRAEALAELDRAKTTFFSNISHEFRTPLTLMLGPLEEVLAKGADGVRPDNRALVDVAHRNGLRLMKLVNALLDFSRIEAGRIRASYRPTDLATYTGDLASSFRSVTQRAGLALIVDTPPLSRPAYVDRDMWEKIVLNLVSNAFKFTLDGEIRITLREEGDTARLTVRDTGIGIAAEELPRLFERFHRVEGAQGRTFEGSGIGLALVQELVHLHGGTVEVASTPGKGTVFTVLLPFGPSSPAAEQVGESTDMAAAPLRADAFVEEALRWLPPAEPAGHASPGAAANPVEDPAAESEPPPRIVLADDNADMRDYVRRLLTPRYTVEAVADGEAALAAIRRERPDLLLTDVMMPRMDGFELLRQIRADPALRDLAVVMLSARAGEEAQVEGIEAGADDYLVKPFSAREMIARVSTNLDLSRSRRRAEAALRELNLQLSRESARLNRMFEQAPTLMAVLRGPDHVFELANPVYLDLIGHRDIIGKPVRQALPEIPSQGFIEQLDEVYRTGKPYVGVAVSAALARRPDQPLEERILDFVFQPLTDHDGQISGIFVQGTDVTERVRVEQALAVQNRTLELLNRTGAELAGELDLERLVRMVTDAGVEMTGARFGAFISVSGSPDGPDQPLYALTGLDDSWHDRVALVRKSSIAIATLEGRRILRTEDLPAEAYYADLLADLGLTGQELPVRSCVSVPVVSRSGDLIGGLYFGHPERARFNSAHEQLLAGIAGQAAIAIDNARLFEAAQREITERRLAEDAVRELNLSLEERIAAAVAERDEVESALRQAQKMEAVGQLTGGIAHDFNNLLTIITGNLDMALRTLGDDAHPRLHRAMGNALKGAERAASLTRRLLAFSRRQPLAPQPLDVARLIEGMSDLLQRTLGETVQLETRSPAESWQVEADGNQLESCLLNLAVNARDAMPDGGRLLLETSHVDLDRPLGVGDARVLPGSYVVISVSDTGTGMSHKTLTRVFEPFFTTKEVGKGTGLGLSMVYGFVRQSGGHIDIESTEGAGTTVRIYLPRLMTAAAAPEERDRDPTRSTGRGETILVVEDDDDVRACTVEILHELGYQVLEAADGTAALRVLEQTDLGIDLLFTDVVMPGMSGPELAHAARPLRPALPVLYTSGYTRDSIPQDDPAEAEVDLLPKPFTAQALADRLRDILDVPAAAKTGPQ